MAEVVEQAGVERTGVERADMEARMVEQPRAADFVLDLLAELRASGYRPEGWVGFLGRSWRQSRATARAHPALVASWRRVAVGLGSAQAAALLVEAACGAVSPARSAAPASVVGLAIALADTYVHLGLNDPKRGQALYAEVGAPTTLTLARRGIAALLWGHLLARRPVGRGYLATALLAALATDMADGALARRHHRTTRLGSYMDGAADFELWSAVALTLSARRLLPRWLLALLLARWLGPLAVAYASYFGWVSRVELGSTAIGKLSGGAQAATLGVALLPETAQRRLGPLRTPLHVVTAGLLVVAPLAHLRKLRDLQLRRLWQVAGSPPQCRQMIQSRRR